MLQQAKTKIDDSFDDGELDQVEAKSMLRILSEQFFEHKLAVFGLSMILFFITLSLSAPLLQEWTGVSADEQNVFKRYQPPMSYIEVAEDTKEEIIEKLFLENEGYNKTIPMALYEAGLIDEADSEEVFDLILEGNKDLKFKLAKVQHPDVHKLVNAMEDFSTLHILGTDELGRDVLMRLIFGSRISIGVGLLVALASALVGLIIGSLAGFYGGYIDAVLSRVIDALLSLPLLPLMIVFAAVDLNKIPFLASLIGGPNESIFKLVIILVLFSWMSVARLARGSILSIKEREFILAAKTIGARDSFVILQHLVPNIIAPLLVSITLNVGNSILWEASLSFLGLGIQPPTPSWGNMLNNAQEMIFEAPILALLPGILILMTVISFNFVGDGLQDAIDPKSIKR